MQLVPPEGQKLSEVDVPELNAPSSGMADDTSFDFLAHVAERWRINTGGKTPKLEPKAGTH